jgi:y4mF family transcriptional regulator
MQIRTPKDIGLLIREARRSKSMTGAQLARQAGVAHSWLSEIENGKPTAEIGKVLQVMLFLGLTMDVTPPGSTSSISAGLASQDTDYPNLDDIIQDGMKP